MTARPLLTPRQREVLALTAAGETAAGIAALLGVSPETAQNHMEAVRLRLGAATQAHAVYLALGGGVALALGGTPYKRCCRCRRVLRRADGYHRDRTQGDGLSRRCRACQAAYHAALKARRRAERTEAAA